MWRYALGWLTLGLTLGYPAAAAGQAHHAGGSHHGGAPQAADTVPLYEDLGTHHYAITTQDERAQAYFDQGLRLYYAFNHSEAIRSFREAQRIDPECAMCWWGEALAWGPNINMSMDSPAALAAYAALERAVAVRSTASEREMALIDALAKRYAPTPPEPRTHLDEAYAGAMRSVATRYPDDTEAAVLYAESLMDLRPWDYWTEDGRPKSGIREALTSLETVLERNENHPGACHFYIHAVEQLYPERAVPCAERLAALMPGAGHLVHMPGHIYIRVGRYQDAIEANQHAVHADESYIQDQRPGMTVYTAGYYPHNYDFLAFAALMIGREEQSIHAAEQVATLLPAEMFGEPGMDFLQHWSIRPLLVRVRFERWDEILAVPAPPEGRSHARAIWHYARGRAYAATGDLHAASQELERLRHLAGTTAGVRMEFNQSADLLAVADRILSGWIDATAGRFDGAVEHLREAVRLEDGLLYGEPPEWTVPVRQDLGAVLLRAGRAAEAERAFLEDLERFPENVWSTRGLAEARSHLGDPLSDPESGDEKIRRAGSEAAPSISAREGRGGNGSCIRARCTPTS